MDNGRRKTVVKDNSFAGEMLAPLTAMSVACVGGLTYYYYLSQVVRNVFAFVFFCPPQLLINDLRSVSMAVYLFAASASVSGGQSVCATLQYLIDEELVVGHRVWLEIAHSAAHLVLLPLYFAIIRPPTTHTALAVDEKATNEPISIVLPGGVIVSIVFPSGSLMGTVVKSKVCKTVARCYFSYYALIYFTIAAAAAAVSLELVAPDTIQAYLCVSSLVSLVYCAPRFFYPDLNTHRASRGLFYFVLPAALAATYLLHATGTVDLDSMMKGAQLTRSFLWMASFSTGFLVKDAFRSIQNE